MVRCPHRRSMRRAIGLNVRPTVEPSVSMSGAALARSREHETCRSPRNLKERGAERVGENAAGEVGAELHGESASTVSGDT